MKDGYPEDHELEALKAQLNAIPCDFKAGAEAVKELIDATGYGDADWSDNKFIVYTRGWSGCEEIIAEISKTLWYLMNWESSHRGGKDVFSKVGTE